ncbi:MAG TPA: hypothetical protein VNA24_21025 [Hyalangium sp.]|nr:hypothetical protein [Hyalangium sp.]
MNARFVGMVVMSAVLGLGGTASAQAYAGVHELSNCTIPTRIVFQNVNVGFPTVSYRPMRFVQYPGGSLNLMYAQPGYSTGKNFTMNYYAAPLQAQNCSNGGPSGTQWLTFRLKTTNYFSPSSGVVDHLVFSLRSNMTHSSFDGIGMILMPQYGGMMGERFRYGIDGFLSQRQVPTPSTQIPLQDGVEYAVTIHATANYTSFGITNVATGATTGFVGMPNPSGYPLVNGSGLFMAALCSGSIGYSHCENFTSTPFTVDIWAISSGWF